jgi:hypothetical protein
MSEHNYEIIDSWIAPAFHNSDTALCFNPNGRKLKITVFFNSAPDRLWNFVKCFETTITLPETTFMVYITAKSINGTNEITVIKKTFALKIFDYLQRQFKSIKSAFS